MKSIKYYVPNTITCLNLFSGCIACVNAFNEHFLYAALFIFLGSVFDFFDGMSARLLHAPSDIGKELDSLADMVTFGMAPGLIVFAWLNHLSAFNVIQFLPFIAFLIPIFSALRLAKFNIDERQTSSFIGLPTPANAIFMCSFFASADQQYFANDSFLSTLANNVWFVVAISIIFSLLLVCELPMFSLKVKSLKWTDNKVRFIFLGISLLLLIVFQFIAIPFVILIYILLSIFLFLKK